MNLTRLWETVTGRPHQNQDAGMVRSATNRLMIAAEKFNESIRPYEEANDPMAMLFRDIARQRKMARGRNESKHHA